MGRTRDARRVIKVPAVWAGRRARIEGGWCDPADTLRVTVGGKACWAYTSTVPVERSGILAAQQAWMPSSGGIHFVD
jgi:hypothetical protein